MIQYDSNELLKLKMREGVESAYTEVLSREKNKVHIGLIGINGENLVFIMNQDISNQLSLLKNLYGRLGAVEAAYQDNVIIDCYHSATIEGARTTVDNVRKALEGRAITKDDKMVVNSIKGFYYALNNPLSLENLLKLWKIVIDGVCENTDQSGERFRKGMVYIGNAAKVVHTPEIPDKIEDRMTGLYSFMYSGDLDSFVISCILHFYFLYIHPFCDGNGRTARILASAYLDKSGYEKIKAVSISRVINENLAGYYKSILESEQPAEFMGEMEIDVTPFIVYMLNTLEVALLSAIASSSSLSDLESYLIQRMKKNNNTEISISKCSKVLKTSLDEADSVLCGLVKKGYLEEHGKIFKLIV